MKRVVLMLPVLVCILVAASTAYCSTYYVSPTGNDTTGDGSIGNPWKTIPTAVTAAAAGDTIYLRGGTHVYTTSITITKNGTAGAKINLFAYPGERPVLDFSGEASGSRGVQLNASYWYIKGIDFYKAGDNGMIIEKNNASYNRIELCNFYENLDSGLQLANGAAYNEIINCDSYYNADSTQGNADGFSPKLTVGTGNYFYGCRSWQNSDDAYDGYLGTADDVTTTYENCWAFKAGYLKDGSIAINGNGNGFKMGGGTNYRHNVTLINCLSFSNKAKGFDQNHNVGDMTLYNCTAFSNGGYNYSIYEAPASGKTVTLTNCVGFTGSNNLGTFVVETTNSWMSPFVVTSDDFVSIDPSEATGLRKADGSLPDITFMHLAAGSDLIDGGTNVGLPYNGSGPDLGCFETGTSDTTPPTPNPMTFATAPYATGPSSIAMVASTATDDTGGVEYYFTCTSGGGHNSGWQSGTSYTDTGLTPSTTYSYTVMARDTTGHNETEASSPASAVTPADITAPMPDPMTWASVPTAAGSTSITMTATTAADASPPVQYYFECTTDAGKSSSWQTSTTYVASGLTPSTLYSFRVRARDSSLALNVTGWSNTLSATTADSIPTFVAAGTAVSGTSAITVAWPTHQAGDIALLFVESAGGQAATLSTPAGFAAVANSPQSTGTGTAGTRITVFWCRATSSSMSSPVVTDPGDHAYGRILTFRNVISTGDPWDVTAGGNKATASTTTTFGTVTTTVNNDLIVLAATRDNDATTAAWSSWTNANLSGLTEQSDGGTTSGNGGGIGVATGLKATAGSTGSSTATVTSSVDGHMTIALKPEPVVAPPGQASSPVPSAGAANVSLTQDLSWTAGSGAASHDVYFGTAASPPFIGNQAGTTYNPGTLVSITTYYWRIDEKNAGGTTTGTVWSFTTQDIEAPLPNPIVWTIEPNAISSSSITMTATTATDISGVEYYFANVTDPNHDSNWVSSPVWTDTGLVNNTTYTYQVKARDMSINHNETGWSDTASATTLIYVCTSPIASDLDGDCEVDFFDYALLADGWTGDLMDIAQFAIDWLTCNRDPASECWQ